ncbi:MAG TPA: thioredoxin-like domain-containing protein [Luteolibacter sp.]
MRTSLPILFSGLLAATVHAEFRTWTRNDGKTAELELVSVSEAGGEKAGEFKMRNGGSISLKASSLAASDARLLADWKPASAATPDTKVSVFDEILDGSLIKLSGKSLRACKDATKPTKHYIFYYTASWCGPCHKYTPSLVAFYNKNKNANFELILVTSDDDESAMEEYAKEMKMPWPQLKLSKASKFKKEFSHGVTGIPSVIICDLEGKIVSRTESIPELEKLVK